MQATHLLYGVMELAWERCYRHFIDPHDQTSTLAHQLQCAVVAAIGKEVSKVSPISINHFIGFFRRKYCDRSSIDMTRIGYTPTKSL
jgi:hypothetical protein